MADTPWLCSVSETASWNAMARALESERPDAVFRDAYARLLAGESGERFARNMAHPSSPVAVCDMDGGLPV